MFQVVVFERFFVGNYCSRMKPSTPPEFTNMTLVANPPFSIGNTNRLIQIVDFSDGMLVNSGVYVKMTILCRMGQVS